MLAYNHEKFIAQAIESVLMQETDFPVELVIGEDCSTDGTRRIVQDYARKYPNAIRALLPERNLGMHQNSVVTDAACRGGYVAFLEGDDCWTSPQKLQNQIRSLEASPECVFACHSVEVIGTDSGREIVIDQMKWSRDRIEMHDLIFGNPVATCSVLIRRAHFLIELPGKVAALKFRDWPRWLLASLRGPIVYSPDCHAKYRKHLTGSWSTVPAARQQLHILDFLLLLPSLLPGSCRQAIAQSLGRNVALAVFHAETTPVPDFQEQLVERVQAAEAAGCPMDLAAFVSNYLNLAVQPSGAVSIEAARERREQLRVYLGWFRLPGASRLAVWKTERAVYGLKALSLGHQFLAQGQKRQALNAYLLAYCWNPLRPFALVCAAFVPAGKPGAALKKSIAGTINRNGKVASRLRKFLAGC